MICPHCGRYLEDGVAFCIYCGQRLGKYASDDAAEGSPTISLDEPLQVEEPAFDAAAAVEEPAASEGPAHAAAGAAAAGAAAAAAATAPVAPANAQEGSQRPSVKGRGTRDGRLHADDEIAQRMSDLGDEEKSGRGRKVLGGVILAALAAGAIGFGANYVAPSIMEGASSSSTATQSTGSSGSDAASSSSSSSKAGSSSSAKSSKSSKSSESSSSATETKRGSTLERANQADDDADASTEGSGNAAAPADDTVEATPTTGEETTTGIVNTYVPSNGGATGPAGGNGSTGWSSSNATATATSISPTEGSVSHGPELVLDGRTETAWNTNMDGVGQSITISVDSAQPIAGLKVMNGYNKISSSGTDLYYANARAKKILVEYEGGSQEFTLDDLKGDYQTVWFDNEVTTSWVKITIKSVYPGSLYDDCCISEIEVV